jgi:hypothetical protein
MASTRTAVRGPEIAQIVGSAQFLYAPRDEPGTPLAVDHLQPPRLAEFLAQLGGAKGYVHFQ